MDSTLAAQLPIQLLQAFGAGLLTLLTPCIYPLIPITLSVAGITSACSRWSAFRLAACYVAGICITYTVLGLLAAQSGILFGSFLGNPMVALGMAAFYLALALASLELIHLRWLTAIQHHASKIGGEGYLGLFFMGAVSGLVAAPCAGPVLAVILALAAQSGDLLHGGLLLFVYSIGLGLPFLLLGTFSNLINKLPRSGGWLSAVKFIIAAALVAVAGYLLQPHLPESLSVNLDRSAIWILAITLGFVGLICGRIGFTSRYRWMRLVGATLLAVGATPLLLHRPFSQSTVAHQEMIWGNSLEAALAEAQQSNRLIVVDFYAEWCGACNELDVHTFSNAAVQEKLSQFIAVRIDVTLLEDAHERLLRKYKVPGLPAVLFLTPDGNEIPNTRIAGFLAPEPFLEALQQVGSDGESTRAS